MKPESYEVKEGVRIEIQPDETLDLPCCDICLYNAYDERCLLEAKQFKLKSHSCCSDFERRIV